jgi:hypothetical protein
VQKSVRGFFKFFYITISKQAYVNREGDTRQGKDTKQEKVKFDIVNLEKNLFR